MGHANYDLLCACGYERVQPGRGREGQEDSGEGMPIKITYGYSKDYRPDLKQAMLGLICANASSLPI